MPNRPLLAFALIGWTGLVGLAGWTLAQRNIDTNARFRTTVVPGSSTAAARDSAALDPSCLRVSLIGVNTAEALMTQLASSFGQPTHAHWEDLSLRPETSVRFDIPAADVETTFRLLNSQRPRQQLIGYRVFADHAEVASASYFDRQEITAVNYDLTSLVRLLQAAADPASPPTTDQLVRGIVDTIQTNVTMEDWADNGGDLGRVVTIGSGLLVSAPARTQPQVAWVLEQMERTPGWTTGLQRLLAPASGAVKAVTGTGAAPAQNPATPGQPPTPASGNP